VRLLHPSVRDLTPEDLFDLYDDPGPHLRANFVTSVDGAIAVDGRSGPLGSPADKAVFRALRTVCDAVVVGAGTLRAEDYGPVLLQPQAKAWREAHGRAPEVPVVVVTRSGDLGSGRVRQGPVLVTGTDLPLDPAEMVAALHDRGLTRLLCEGGPALLRDLLEAGLVDELCLTATHTVAGAGPRLVEGLSRPVDLRLRSLVHDDPGVLLCRWSVVPSAGD
jgi:5-amino-6-(5-phosphoribosylamino)uracil reductase